VDLLDLQRRLDAGEPARSSALDARARLGVGVKGEVDPVPGRNVVAFLPGRDRELRDEWIVVGAHHDHVGSFPGEGDTVFNGADDNASGTAGVLALARAFASAPTPPRRSLLFATFSAEERGVLGSRALVASGKLPLDRIALMVNLDMIGRNPGRPVDVFGDGYALGLREIVEEANESVKLPLSTSATATTTPSSPKTSRFSSSSPASTPTTTRSPITPTVSTTSAWSASSGSPTAPSSASARSTSRRPSFTT